MKKIVWVFSIVLMLVFENASQAQVLKKLQRKIQDKVEQKAVDKVSDEVEEENFKAINEISNAEAISMGYGKNKIDASVVPNSYQFSWKYSLEIQNETEKPVTADYFLEPNAAYFGLNMGDSNEMFMIMDTSNKLTVTCFDQNGEKVAMALRIPDYKGIVEKENKEADFSYRSLPDKIIMGYNCKGIEAVSDDYVVVFYYTNNAKVSFSDLFQSQQKRKTPDALQYYFKSGEKPLMMMTTIKDLKNKGAITTMKCVSLEKHPYSFIKSDYKFM